MSKPKFITVVIARPGKLAQAISIENTLEGLQKCVEGYIERVPTRYPLRGVVMYANEEGLLRQMAPNRVFEDYSHAPIVGPIVAVRGTDKSFTEDEAKKMIHYLDERMV